MTGPSSPTGTTRLAAVIGSPVRHSLSPVLHNAAFEALGLDWVYVALEVAPGEAGAAVAAMRTLGLGGLSVTMPHKEDVAAAVDRCADDAARLGAVNCVVPEPDGTLVGHNTDGPGFLAGLAAESGVDPRGRSCVVVGAGGAGRAVAMALGRAGAAEVAVVNRSRERAEAAVGLIGETGRVVEPAAAGPVVAAADVVVNATSVGMGRPGPDDVPFDVSVLHAGQVVVDAVYQPLVTPLLAAAARRGAVAVGGIPMLVGQAAVAFELWTGHEAPVEAMVAAARSALAG